MQKFIISHTEKIPFNATITGPDARHMAKVLRMKINGILALTDGNGMDYTARITSICPSEVKCHVFEQTQSLSEPPVDITLCSGMLKDNKMDLIIKHVTQLGITRWIPFYCQRSVPKPNRTRIEKRLERWQTIARESVKQCGRSRLPEICLPVDFEKLMTVTTPGTFKIAFWEEATAPLRGITTPDHGPAVILIGPEGGFSETEIQSAQAHGFSEYSLGPRILRAETAAISACTLLQHLIGDI